MAYLSGRLKDYCAVSQAQDMAECEKARLPVKVTCDITFFEELID
jgi:hypothetical protein